jgi:hypothetical protein
MAIPGRFRPDGCWTAVKTPATPGKKILPVFVQNNRKFRRSGGVTS